MFADRDSVENKLKLEKSAWESDSIYCFSVVYPGLHIDTSKELVYLRQEVEKLRALEHLSFGKALKMIPTLLYKSLRRRVNLLKKSISLKVSGEKECQKSQF